jgi:hypothetical protein
VALFLTERFERAAARIDVALSGRQAGLRRDFRFSVAAISVTDPPLTLPVRPAPNSVRRQIDRSI